jgi:2-polyprenyl-3-methyl-5-hydroxy-6-metoxy-1,4-benzoquinol methylase
MRARLGTPLENWIYNCYKKCNDKMGRRLKKYIEERSDFSYIDKKDPWSSHSIIHNWLSGFQSGTRVLDIGTATGLLGKRCIGSGFYLKGLEPVPEYVEKARIYYNEILCSSLEEAPEEFLKKQDIVICADVLEHMPNPEKILKYLVYLQKPDTQFFVSVPNVANIWVRINLLFGKFNYTKYGILDRTHLRFFTKFTFLEMLHSSGLRPIEVKYTPIPLSRVNSFFQTHLLGRLIHNALYAFVCLWPGLLAYQFVARTEILHDEDGS